MSGVMWDGKINSLRAQGEHASQDLIGS